MKDTSNAESASASPGWTAIAVFVALFGMLIGLVTIVSINVFIGHGFVWFYATFGGLAIMIAGPVVARRATVNQQPRLLVFYLAAVSMFIGGFYLGRVYQEIVR